MPVFQELHHSSLPGDGHLYITTQSDLEASICPPPCDCVDCQHSFYTSEEQYDPRFSYRGRVSHPDAQRIATRHVQDAQQDREHLLQRLTSHADVILNRWKKKSREKRQALLVNAIPELYECRWLIPRYTFTPESKLVGCQTSARRCQLLLPWLSLEVLKMNPAVLFGLLHNRTTYPPQDWAPYDSRQLILSWACGHFEVEFSSKCVVMYGPRYGELVDWQPGPAHRADIMGFPRARLVLEAQAYLMGALRKIVDKILEGVDLSKPATSEKWKLMTSPGFKHAGEVEFWSSYTNQAFSAPPVFDVDNLVSIAQIRLNALGDHLWFLQTETAYMRRYIRVLFQGEYYKVVKADGAGVMVAQELFMDVLAYWWWSWVKNECEYVKSMHDRFRDGIYPGERLPPRYDRALGALELLLVNRVISQAMSLMVVLPHRPGFSHNWSFERRASADPTLFQIHRETTTEQKELFDKDPLEWCLVQMQGAPDTQTNFDHAMLFAFLENHLANSSSKEKARVDEVLYQKLSDLAAYHEMLVSVRLHRPQNEARDIDEVMQSENRVAWKRMKTQEFLSQDDKVILGTALLKHFYDASSSLPSGKKDVAWLKRSQPIRKALEAFWTGLRECSGRMLQRSDFSAEEVRAMSEVISANLSPEYIGTIQAEEQQVLANSESARVPTTVPLQKEWGSNTTTQPSVPVSKPKRKTRPAEQPEVMEEIENRVAGIIVDSSQESSLTIPVKKRAFDVLTLMFPATAEEAARSVNWDNFVYAMSDMGFTARNGGGSDVVFENRSSVKGRDTADKIVFHKPHPVPKIDPVMLHSWGKRMVKWFGWHRDLFILES